MSAGREDIRKQTRVTTEERASERLFTPSASTEMLWNSTPASIFPPPSSRLQAAPTPPAARP